MRRTSRGFREPGPLDRPLGSPRQRPRIRESGRWHRISVGGPDCGSRNGMGDSSARVSPPPSHKPVVCTGFGVRAASRWNSPRPFDPNPGAGRILSLIRHTPSCPSIPRYVLHRNRTRHIPFEKNKRLRYPFPIDGDLLRGVCKRNPSIPRDRYDKHPAEGMRRIA